MRFNRMAHFASVWSVVVPTLTEALRDAFTAVLKHLPLQRSEATMVASSVLRPQKCLHT